MHNQQWEALDFTEYFPENDTENQILKGPVIAAPFQLTLGGGTEIIQPAAHRVVAAEAYMGFVGVGLKFILVEEVLLEMILNALDSGTGRMGAFQKMQKTFETIGFAKVTQQVQMRQAPRISKRMIL